ncbi:phosphoserine phosphatase SerB [Thiomicrorhabdus lithotrophica]|uniref:Phosphoserine phosphatase n=1 Tax=Thiomicrorhabdus lithotrophica TaxID=2949997 RepID=A0ABY8CBC4_9GAMM|nr:phosphoserine phosphatase SerB [Thiomicrorhabdus lithotrophica]WEJ63279.1 phosphoserine phosphatase SerB [Thiomicrorhabdus lithotrophica]
MATIIIHSNTLNFEQSKVIERAYGQNGKPTKIDNHFRIELDHRPDQKTLKELSEEIKIDINLLPEGFDGKEIKLVISDMDSTLISIECVDEIADYINVKPEVSAITEAAMRGELNFEDSLKKRVGLLKGLDTSALQYVYSDRLKLNPGAEKWVSGLHEQNIKFALVSGGFTFFTERLKQELGLDFARANVLGESNGELTGEVIGGIIGAQAKSDFLHELCEKLNITPNQVIAVGDGANDLLMMKEAGLSVAYHAKPKVQEQATTALNYSGLDAILDFTA